MVWLLWQWEEVAAALEGESLRGQAAKVGGPEVLRFGLAGTDTGSEPGRRVRSDYLSMGSCIKLTSMYFPVPGQGSPPKSCEVT